MGLLHGADCVHSQGRAHARHRLPGLRPRGTGTAQHTTRVLHFTYRTFSHCVRFFLPLSASLDFTIIQCGDIKGSSLLLTNYRCWKCHQKAASTPNVTPMLQGGFCSSPPGVGILNDTSVITVATLARQLHPGMLYLVDFTGGYGVPWCASQRLTGPGCVTVR